MKQSDLDVIHISQLLDYLIQENDIGLDKKDLAVTYHDPCHLGRLSGIYEEGEARSDAFPGRILPV